MSTDRPSGLNLDDRGLPADYPFDPSQEVTPRELRDQLASGTQVHLIDCRLPAERAITSIEPSLHVPLQTLAQQYEDDIAPLKNETIVVYCRIGGRSLDFARRLQREGFANVKSLAGGINLWNADFGGGPLY